MSKQDSLIASLTIGNRAVSESKTWFEDYGVTGKICHTCHCPYSYMFSCKCGNVMCEACVKWSRSDVRVLNFNRNRKTKKRQRYVLETIKFNSYICNKCRRVVGYRL